jgi:hypothetical protein
MPFQGDIIQPDILLALYEGSKASGDVAFVLVLGRRRWLVNHVVRFDHKTKPPG